MHCHKTDNDMYRQRHCGMSMHACRKTCTWAYRRMHVTHAHCRKRNQDTRHILDSKALSQPPNPFSGVYSIYGFTIYYSQHNFLVESVSITSQSLCYEWRFSVSWSQYLRLTWFLSTTIEFGVQPGSVAGWGWGVWGGWWYKWWHWWPGVVSVYTLVLK